MEAQVSIKSGESYHISGSATRGESYRISGSFNNKGLAQNLKEFWASFLQKIREAMKPLAVGVSPWVY